MSDTQQPEEEQATAISAAYLDALSEVDLARIAEFDALDEKQKSGLRQLFKTDPNAGIAW
jgi:hypothetical protein